MPALNPGEVANLQSLSLLTFCQTNLGWFISQAQILVVNARSLVTAVTGSATGTTHTFSEDEIAVMINAWLAQSVQWQNVLNRKAHVLFKHHVLITDLVSRYIAYTYYTVIA